MNSSPVLTTRVFKKIEEIPPADWNSVFPNTLEGYRFFKTLDESGLTQFQLYYILVYDGGTPVGAAPCFLMDYSLDTTIQGPLKSLSTLVKKFFPRIFSLKTLICGSPAGPGYIGIIGEPERVIRAISRGMEPIAEVEKVAIVAFKEFGPADAKELTCLEQEGFCRFESNPNTRKEIRFKSFDDYLKTLSSATRYDLKRKFKKVDGRVRIQFEVVDRLGDSLEEAYGLYRQMVSRHEVGFEIMSKEFFVKISQNMPGETKFFLWRVEGKLAAFAFCLVSNGYFLDYYIGLDYSMAYEYHLYFIRFRDMMNWCLQHGIRTYEMGCTNYDPKKRLGFEFIPLTIYAKMRNKRLNPFLGRLCDLLKPERFDPVLKEMKLKFLSLLTVSVLTASGIVHAEPDRPAHARLLGYDIYASLDDKEIETEDGSEETAKKDPDKGSPYLEVGISKSY